MDISPANVLLLHIWDSLAASQDQGTWVLTSYLVSIAVVLPMGGRTPLYIDCLPS